jgi:hypothetical protein
MVGTAKNEGRVNRRVEWDAGLYRQVIETKRALSELDRKLYEIKIVSKPETKKEMTFEEPLKKL